MIEIIVGLFFMLIFGGKENSQDKNENDEMIRPILFDNFQDHDYDGGDGE